MPENVSPPKRLCCFQLDYDTQRIIVLACERESRTNQRYCSKSEFVTSVLLDWAKTHMPDALPAALNPPQP